MKTSEELQEWCYQNWLKVPELIRQDCINSLADWLPVNFRKELAETYEKESVIAKGIFHFGVGMQIRNRLRSQFTDEELPPVDYPDGKRGGNWDDYYLGAVQQLIEQDSKNSLY